MIKYFILLSLVITKRIFCIFQNFSYLDYKSNDFDYIFRQICPDGNIQKTSYYPSIVDADNLCDNKWTFFNELRNFTRYNTC